VQKKKRPYSVECVSGCLKKGKVASFFITGKLCPLGHGQKKEKKTGEKRKAWVAKPQKGRGRTPNKGNKISGFLWYPGETDVQVKGG